MTATATATADSIMEHLSMIGSESHDAHLHGLRYASILDEYRTLGPAGAIAARLVEAASTASAHDMFAVATDYAAVLAGIDPARPMTSRKCFAAIRKAIGG